MPGPIKPSEVADAQEKNIPEPVFEAFNELIAANWSGSSAIIRQEDVVALILEKTKLKRRDMPYHWLNIEEAYRAHGWRVEYDKPGFNETYAATFEFRKAPGEEEKL